MNFLPCQVDGRIARVGDTAIPLSEKTADLAHAADGALELGIRPMHLEIHSESVDQAISVTVKGTEDLGSYKILTIALNDHIIRARLPEETRPPRQHAWLRFPDEWTRIFADGRLVG